MLLKKLVEIRSKSGNEEEIKNFVADYLERLGYEVYEDEQFIAVNPKKKLIVATHLDTVSFKTEFYTDDVYAYGTGVADAKGSVAAMLQAAEKGVNYTLSFFCNEEEGGSGSASFIKKWKWGEYALVMEPTQLKIASKHYGCIEAEILVKGLAAHASMPEYGRNAIEIGCKVISELKKNFKVTIFKIEGGTGEYVVPDLCKIRFDVLTEPEEDALEKLKNFEKFGELKIFEVHKGFYSKRASEILEKAIKAAGYEVEYTYMPSWTDAINLSKRYDCVVWGPGDLSLCHTEFEKIKISDIDAATNVLLKLNNFVD
ncbi:MAG: M20/M25/M40 family metallo-hydrolase [Archaeoglobaceae archaeon]